MALGATKPRIEAALAGEPTSAPCRWCCQRVFAPGWWCDDCDVCAFPTLLLDSDHEPNGDEEPDGCDEPDDDYT